jgi:hypothetical protein
LLGAFIGSAAYVVGVGIASVVYPSHTAAAVINAAIGVAAIVSQYA